MIVSKELKSVSSFKVTQINEKTIEFEVLKENLNKEYKDCGIITSDPKYWCLTPKTRKGGASPYDASAKGAEGVKES